MNPSVRNFLFYLLFQGTRFVFPVVMTPYLAHVFGPGTYGDVVALNSCIVTSALLMEFGFYIYAVNATASAENKEQLRAVISGVVTAKLAFSPVAITGFLVASSLLGITERQPVAVMAALLTVLSMGMSFAWYFQGLQRGATAVLLEAVPLFTQFGLVFVFVHTEQDMWRAAALQAGAAVATLLGSYILLHRREGAIKLDFEGAKKHARASIPFFAERLSFSLNSTSTPLVIGLLSTREQVAHFGLGERFLTVLTAIHAPVFQTALPAISKRIKARPGDWTLSLAVTGGATAFVAALGLVGFFAAPVIVSTLLGAVYQDAVPVLQACCLVAVLQTYQLAVANFILVPAGRAKILLPTSIAAVAINLGVQMVLVPKIGALGSAFARILAESLLAVTLSIVAAQHILKTRSRGAAL